MSIFQRVDPVSTSAFRACPVCSGTECAPLHAQRFVLPEGHPLAQGYSVVACQHCGFVYADTDVTEQRFDDFYASRSKYEDSQLGTGGGGSPWDRRRLADTAQALAAAFDHDVRVLDIGCANGGLLGELYHAGFTNLTGVDPSPVCVKNTRAHGFAAHQGCLPNLPDIGKFDLVIVSHVLEHLLDPGESLVALAKILRNGGSIYAEVPDAARYHEFLVAPFQDFNTEHINHFSPVCLTNLFARCGCERTAGGIKTIASSADSLTPAVFGIYRKVDGEPAPPARDERLPLAIGEYIQGSQQLLNEIDRHLRESLSPEEHVVIWGTGQLTMKLLCETVLERHTVAAFVDSNPVHQGDMFHGVPVLSPQQLQERGLTEPIIIGSLLHGREIVTGIRERYHLPNTLIQLRPEVLA